MFRSVLVAMSFSEGGAFIPNDRRQRVLRALVESYYADLATHSLCFDTNRAWCGLLPSLVTLFSGARLICCVRSIAWVLDSLERLVQRNAFHVSKLFGPDGWYNVYTRVEAVMMKNGLVGSALAGLRQAWYSEEAGRIVAIRYESLVESPASVVGRLYECLGEEPYPHDFEHVEYECPEFDAQVGLPGLHTVLPRVQAVRRKKILPPDLFARHEHSFWEEPGQNPRAVTIL
jgi:sulfotransferase